MEKSYMIDLALRCFNKKWDFETLKYGDDLYGKEEYAEQVWEYVEECEEIGRDAFIKKYISEI
jgi:hypothetical protein